MRLFTAIAITGEVRATLSTLLEGLRPVSAQRWSPPENLHVTTRFIGEWPEAQWDELRAALHAMPKPNLIDIAVRGLGWFPNPHSPNAFFAGVEASAELTELARQTEAACTGLGLVAETKRYVPHVTLARVKSHDGLRELRQAIASLDTLDFGRFAARSFHLYESRTGPDGSIYIPLEEFPLL